MFSSEVAKTTCERGFRLSKQKFYEAENMMRIPLFCKFFNLHRPQNVSTAVKQISTASFPLQFKASSPLCAEPMKKKKRLDPSIIRAREEKRKRRIEREIRRLKKSERQLKPVFELEIPISVIEEPEKRKREVQLSEEVRESRRKLLKEWAKAKYKESKSDMKLLTRILAAQEEALRELRLESEELYQAAVKIDTNLIPFKFSGPSETPAKLDYPLPDGEYIDESKKW